MSAFQATNMTTARLNIRNNPNITAPLVTTLELGTEVQVLETGSLATIGEITAPWVRVLTANGFIGWCFSGFLEVVAVDVAAVESPMLEAPAVASPQADDIAGSGMPLWVWFVVIGGIVAVGGVVFIVLRNQG